MAIFEEQITEKLESGAPDITYEGNEGQEQKIARQLWDQLPPEAQQQFGNFQQFFSSGAWKQVLQMLQEQKQQAPQQMSQQPQQGLGSIMPAQMAGGGDVRLASHEGNDAFLEQRYEYYLDLGWSPRKAATQAHKDLEEGNFQQDMAYGGIAGLDGRRAYGFGSFIKKAFKKVTKPFKKIAKSPLGKAALMYAGTAGLGNLMQPGAAKWANMKWLKPSTALFNVKQLPGADTIFGKTIGDTDMTRTGGLINWIKDNPWKAGGAAASLAPFAMQAAGKWDTGEEDLSKFAEGDWGFDYKGMIRDIQAAQATGLESEVAKVMAKYNLGRGDMPGSKYIGTAAEGGRIGYDDGGAADRLEKALAEDDIAALEEPFSLPPLELLKLLEGIRAKKLREYEQRQLGMTGIGAAQGGRIGYQIGGPAAREQWAPREKQDLISRLVSMGLPLPQAIKMAEMIIANATPQELQRTLRGTRSQGLTPEESIKFQENITAPGVDIQEDETITDYMSNAFPELLPESVQAPKEYVSLSGAKPDKRSAMLGLAKPPQALIDKMIKAPGEFLDRMQRAPDEVEVEEEISPYGAAEGGLMSLGGNEMDLRGGGFVPIGEREKADDVPARLSKNEFVFTADAVRAAGNGDVDAGADKMYNTMKQLENRVGS